LDKDDTGIAYPQSNDNGHVTHTMLWKENNVDGAKIRDQLKE
jgi:hypothetical protein